MKLNRKNKKAFTIVELVIVIGVIGILSAILIPTFANLTNKANDAALQSNLANAYTAYASDAADGKLDENGGTGTAHDLKGQTAIYISELSTADEAKVSGKAYKYNDQGKWVATTDAITGTLTSVDGKTTTTASTYKVLNKYYLYYVAA